MPRQHARFRLFRLKSKSKSKNALFRLCRHWNYLDMQGTTAPLFQKRNYYQKRRLLSCTCTFQKAIIIPNKGHTARTQKQCNHCHENNYAKHPGAKFKIPSNASTSTTFAKSGHTAPAQKRKRGNAHAV